jgi:hypothetical protein
MPSLTGCDPFAKLVQKANRHILLVCQHAAATARRGDPQWRKRGLKLLELLEPLKQELSAENSGSNMEETSRKTGKGNGGKKGKKVQGGNGVKEGRGVKAGRVEKSQTKTKWQNDRPSSGFGAYVSLC